MAKMLAKMLEKMHAKLHAKLLSLKKDNADDQYAVDDGSDAMDGPLGKKIVSFVKELSQRKGVMRIGSMQELPPGRFYIVPEGLKYKAWWLFIVIVALYSSMFTPVEFGFFRGLPRTLWKVNLVVQFVFVADIVVQFFTAYRDPKTYRLIVDHRSIAFRYIKSLDFPLDFIAILPWDTIYKGSGRKEWVRYLLWFRLYRVRKVDSFFEMLEKSIRINYFLARIAKLLAVEFYCTHTAACIYYYLATTVSSSRESYTWIGSLTLGSFSYQNFRAIDFWKRYVTSLYWAILTMATVGYGDVHAVNPREMIFVMIYVSFDMILGAYLLGNMTALIVKGSNTERFRDKMTSLRKFMERNGLPRSIRNQMKSHVHLQFESGTLTEGDDVLKDFPVSIRAKVARSRYSHIVEQVSIFKGCSSEFLNEIVSKVTEEYFLPGEAVIQQGGSSDQFYVIVDGILEEILVHEDGKEEVIDRLQSEGVFGEVGVLCSIPQPFTVRVTELCRVLRIGKQSFSDIVHIYFNDGRLVINNLLECKDTDARLGQLAADIAFLVAKQGAELALMVNNSSYQGDLVQLKHLVKEGAVVARADYDGRTPLHLAASKGFEAVVLYLIREGGDVNSIDKFGISPLLEAVKGGHDNCLSVLKDNGAELHLQEAGAYLCQAVKSGNNELLRRLLVAGVNASAADYDKRTPLHLAAAEGAFGMAKTLLDAGADSFATDRWGRTALDEALLHKHAPLIELLKDVAHKNRENHVKKLSFPLEGNEECTGGRLGDQRKCEKVQGRIDLACSPQSSGSYQCSPQSSGSYQEAPMRGRLGILERPNTMESQSSSERRVDRRLSMRNSADLEIAPHQFRVMPIRQVGRPALTEQPPSPFSVRNRRRVTIFPYHPWTPTKARTPGKVEWVPPTIEEVLSLASLHLGKVGSKVMNQDAGEISSTDLIMDSEKIYVVDDNDILTGGSSL